MAKTTPVKKKILLFVYGTILFTIMCLLGGLIYIGIEYFDIGSPAESRYEELFEERKSYALDVAELNAEYVKETDTLKVTSDLNKRGETLQKLKSINTQILHNLDKMLSFDNQMKELSLGGEAYEQTLQIYKSDVEKYNLNKLHQDLIQHQIELNNYYIGEAATDLCFTNIDYGRNNTEIAGSISQCIDKIDNQSTQFRKIGHDLPRTEEYLATLREFWSKNNRLYLAIEARDSAQANSLDQEVKALNPILENKKAESRKEITEWILSLEEAITSFEG